jgi:hypothetical protein
VMSPPPAMSAPPTSTAGSALRARRNRIGDNVRLIPGHCDPTVNLYDWYVCVRGNRVKQFWPITARGAVYLCRDRKRCPKTCSGLCSAVPILRRPAKGWFVRCANGWRPEIFDGF